MNKVRDGISESGIVSDVENFFVHPGYNPGFVTSPYDIALLYLKTPMTWNKYIRPACLPSQCDSSYSSKSKSVDGCERGWVAGWGKIKKTPQDQLPNVTMEIAQELKPLKFCEDYWKTIEFSSTSQMCSINMEIKGGACQGDSGGPFNCQAINGKNFIAGVVSWGHGTCNDNEELETAPTIFTRICNVLPWIKKTMIEYEQNKTNEEKKIKLQNINPLKNLIDNRQTPLLYSVENVVEILQDTFLVDFHLFFQSFYCKSSPF